jgi:hypothetical protein
VDAYILLADRVVGSSCRYDGRGALYDLKQYEAQPGGHDANRWVGLSDAEHRVEQLCDEERYRALQHNEEEEALYQGRIVLKLAIEFFLLELYFFLASALVFVGLLCVHFLKIIS